MPAPQGPVFNQLPDGTLVQMQPGQSMVPTVMTSQMPILVNHSGGQLIQSSSGGQLIVSPTTGGLLQVPGLQQVPHGQMSPFLPSQPNFVTVGQVQILRVSVSAEMFTGKFLSLHLWAQF
jgi:hypothetical protein